MKKVIPWAIPDIREEDVEAVKEAIKSGWVGGNGPILKVFEKTLARRVQAKYAIAVNNGTSALITGLLALYRGYYPPTLMSFMRIAVPSLTFIASVNTPFLLSNNIQLLDSHLDTFNVNISEMSSRDIIIPVDVGGVPCNYDEIQKLKIPILEDAAEALGSEYKGKPIGSIADITIFSLHAAKIITAGEGGVITTNSDRLYEKMSSIINQGFAKTRQKWEYEHDRFGLNFRMTEMQAALALSQLKRLDEYIQHRQNLASIYRDILGDKVKYQYCEQYSKNSNFLFPILVQPNKRLSLIKNLLKEGIETKITFQPVHLQKQYNFLRSHLPNSEYIYKRIISLPISNKTTEEDAKFISEKILCYLRRKI